MTLAAALAGDWVGDDYYKVPTDSAHYYFNTYSTADTEAVWRYMLINIVVIVLALVFGVLSLLCLQIMINARGERFKGALRDIWHLHLPPVPFIYALRYICALHLCLALHRRLLTFVLLLHRWLFPVVLVLSLSCCFGRWLCIGVA